MKANIKGHVTNRILEDFSIHVLAKSISMTCMKCKKIYVIFLCLFSYFTNQANQIDIGIFESFSQQNKIEIRVRPNFNISAIQTLSAILYTVRWDDPSITINPQYIYPYFVTAQGGPVLYNGYYYQVFAALPMIAVPMNANQEYLISSFTFLNGSCAKFQIIEDEWTQLHNGDVYLELVGLEVTGIIYHEMVIYGSVGGNITGNDTTILGNSTGPLILSGQNGSVIIWQRKINNGSWTDITGTSGMLTYSEIPPTMGDYFYRVNVQKGNCPAVYSGLFQIVVLAEIEFILKVFLEGAFQGSGMTTNLNEDELIPLSQPYSCSPWNYAGSESVPAIPSNAVDWILLDFRISEGDVLTASSDKSVQRLAVFLMTDGSIKDIDGLQNPKVVLSLNNNLYIVVYHRNHLSVISATSPPIIYGNCYYNFSLNENQVLGGNQGHKALAPGIWGMIAGDANSDGHIDSVDKQFYWQADSGIEGYNSADFSLDSQIDNQDKNEFLYPNQGFASRVP